MLRTSSPFFGSTSPPPPPPHETLQTFVGAVNEGEPLDLSLIGRKDDFWHCAKCSSVWSSEEFFAKHSCSSQKQLHPFVQSTEKIRPHSCEFCTFSCGNVATLYRHELKQHFGQILASRPYACPFCKKRFYDKEELNFHTSRSKACHQAALEAKPPDDDHVDLHRYRCRFCPLRFRRSTTALKHEHRVHATNIATTSNDSPAKQLLYCSSCFTTFTSIGGLSRHLNRLLKCRLEFHRRKNSNTNNKTASAVIDQPSTSSSATLTSSSMKSFSCNFCTAVFLLAHNRAKHERYFHADKLASLFKISCEWCSQRFVNQHALNCHLRAAAKCRCRAKASQIDPVMEECT